MPGDGILQLRGEAAPVFGSVQLHVVDGPARGREFTGEMAHGGKQERDLLLVMAHIGRLVVKLGHQHPVARRVSGGEARQTRRQLIAEDEDQVANARHRQSLLSGQPGVSRRLLSCLVAI